jgi:RNA polymerase sigma-70 factor (ECF subfamily)
LAEFTTLVERHQRRLFVYLRGLVDHAEEAHDLLQETFLDAWRAAQQGKPPLLPDGAEVEMRRWLFHTAYCRAISVLRRRRRICLVSLETTLVLEVEPMDARMPFEDHLVERAAMQDALAGLSPKDKSCLLLMVVQGFTAAETAKIMGDSSQAVDKRISSAKQRLLAVYLAQEGLAQEGNS